jgi:E3 ubiquitin-protein ligase mind-bomb
VIVQWDMGQRCRYRCGRDNKFDLRVLDDGPSGRSYSKHRCHVCRKKRVYGVVWRCLHCPEYYLCSVCYLANHHCSLHRFTCLLDRDGMQFRVPAREDSRCIPVSGLFYGAEVVRGTDWRWNDQDGGVGRTGKVVEVLDWSNEGGSGYERSVVLATWENGNKKKYRAGHKGKVDVRCIAPGSGGFYYPEHLPVLGRGVKPPSSGDIVTGDRIKCEVNLAELDDPEMAEKIGLMLDHVGTVNVLLENGELLVRYPGNSLVQVNPAAAKKVDVPMFESGDVVRMISDMAEVYRLQQGHGEWNDDMALVSGTLLVSVEPADSFLNLVNL